MDTMASRLDKAMKARGVKPGDLISAKVLSKAGIYFLLNGTTGAAKVRAGTVEKLCKHLRISRAWLLDGKGPMDAPSQPDEGEWDDVLGYGQAAGLGTGAEANEWAETHKLKFRTESLSRKRLNPTRLAVMYGKGDSMLPRIHSGDAILFDTGDVKPRDGAVFVVLWKGEYYAKRCEILDDLVFFKTDNPDGDHHWKKPKRMDAKDHIEIIGRVRWIGSWEG